MKRLLASLAVALVTVALVSAQATRQVSLVIANGIVVTVDGASRIVSPGSIAIDGRDIVAVGMPDEIRRQFRGRQTIDATGQVVMPGLINTHTHLSMSLFRGYADDLELREWLEKKIWPLENHSIIANLFLISMLIK